MKMDDQDPRTVFDRLLARSHTEHAIYQSVKGYNDIPTSLAAVLLLGGSATELEAIYECKKRSFEPWRLSPEPIQDRATRDLHMGDPRYQRAFTDYYSMENTRFFGRSFHMVGHHLHMPKEGGRDLLVGLFGGFGRSLILLSDAVELHTAVMSVQALALASVDWNESIDNLLLCCKQTAATHCASLDPSYILDKIATDGRFSGLNLPAPGISNIPNILESTAAKLAVIGYVAQLDTEGLRGSLHHLARTATLLACAAHKPGQPAYDAFLARLPSLVVAFQVLLEKPEPITRKDQIFALGRGVWTLMVLAYISQLRPKIDVSILPDSNIGDWATIFGDLWMKLTPGSKYMDGDFLKLLRSIHYLAQYDQDEDQLLYRRSARALVNNWTGFTGYGRSGERSLNIRL